MKRNGSTLPSLKETPPLKFIQASMEFLLEDLNSPIPSKEPAFLYLLNDRVHLVCSLVSQLKIIKYLLMTIDRHFRHFRNEDSENLLEEEELSRADTVLR